MNAVFFEYDDSAVIQDSGDEIPGVALQFVNELCIIPAAGG